MRLRDKYLKNMQRGIERRATRGRVLIFWLASGMGELGEEAEVKRGQWGRAVDIPPPPQGMSA